MIGDVTESVPASEFTRDVGDYRMCAQREAVAVSSHGRITGYLSVRKNTRSSVAIVTIGAVSRQPICLRRRSLPSERHERMHDTIKWNAMRIATDGFRWAVRQAAKSWMAGPSVQSGNMVDTCSETWLTGVA